MFYNKYNFIIKPPPIKRQNAYSNLNLINKSKNDCKKFIIKFSPIILMVIYVNIYQIIYYIY